MCQNLYSNQKQYWTKKETPKPLLISLKGAPSIFELDSRFLTNPPDKEEYSPQVYLRTRGIIVIVVV